MLHQRLRRRHRQAGLAVQHDRAAAASRRRHLGQAAGSVPRRRRNRGSPAATIRISNLTYWGTAQAKPWMPVSRGMSIKDDALYTSSTLALDVDTGKLAWHFQHAPGEVARPRRGLRARARRRRQPEPACSPSARTASCGSSIARPASTSATRKPCSRTSGSRFDPQTGRPTYRARHSRAEVRRVDAGLSEHRRRSQLAGVQLSPADESADHSAQPELHRDGRAEGRAEGRRRQRRRRGPALLRDAGHRRQYRQARGLRREDA